MLEDIKSVLQEFGLSPKEAEVYLAMLELGPASVQDIAKKAAVNRSTTYVMIEGLKQKGLLSTFEKGKKVLFAAETPLRLGGMIDEDVGKLEAKRGRLDSSMPRLLAIFNAIEDKPKVRFFEGDDSLDLIRQELMDFKEPLIEVFAVDEELVRIANVRPERRKEVHRSIAHGTKILLAIKPGLVPPSFPLKGREVREMDYNAFPFSGEITIAGNRIFIITVKSKGLGIIIESREVSDILRALYHMAWSCAKPWTPPPGWGSETRA